MLNLTSSWTVALIAAGAAAVGGVAAALVMRSSEGTKISKPLPFPKIAGPTPEAKHYDEPRLGTDTMHRFAYLADFLDFGAADIHNIKSVATQLAPLVPAVVDAVYLKLFAYDVTKKYFVARNEGYEGTLPKNINDLTLEHPQIKFRKGVLSKYLVKLVTSEYDASFVNYVSYVGEIHSNHVGAKSIDVPMVHNEVLFGFVEDAFVAILGTFNLSREDERNIIRSLVKLLSIQRSYFVRFCKDLPFA